ncbi:MAG: hypothetical protein RR724_03420, partial [Hydrogenoanaerobacterium sp.]
MDNTTKVVISSVIALVLVLLGTGIYNIFTRHAELPIAEPTSHEESSSMSSVTEDEPLEAGAVSHDAAYNIFSQALASQAAEAAKPKEPPVLPDETIVTENPDGSTNTEIVRHDFSKPEPPPPPKIDEAQRSDPTKEPEYTEEQLRPNENPPQNNGGTNGGTNGGGTTPNKPNTPDTPTGGETN